MICKIISKRRWFRRWRWWLWSCSERTCNGSASVYLLSKHISFYCFSFLWICPSVIWDPKQLYQKCYSIAIGRILISMPHKYVYYHLFRYNTLITNQDLMSFRRLYVIWAHQLIQPLLRMWQSLKIHIIQNTDWSSVKLCLLHLFLLFRNNL